MRISKKNIGESALGLFFIHPFAAFVIALNNLKSKYSFTVILLFNILFGYTFIAQNPNIDSYRYIEKFNEYKYSTTNDFLFELEDYFTFDSRIKDIYEITSYFIVSRFTHNYHFLMALWAFVFSIFFLKALRFFVDRPEFKKSIYASLLAFLFIYSNSIFNINGIRFWTASWVGVYTIFEVIINKKYKFIFLSLFAPLIHVSFIILPVVLLLYSLVFKNEKFFIILFFISFFVGEVSLELVQNFQSYLPRSLQTIIWAYTEGNTVQERLEYYENAPLYAQILRALPRYFIQTLMLIFILKRKHFKAIPEANFIFLFLLVWLSFTNFTLAIPSFGKRFIVLSVPLLMYLSLITYSKIKVLRKVIILIPVVYSYSLLYWVRHMLTVTDPFLIISVFPHIVIKNLF
ncbi:MAG: EpsG family protein [bacterium]